jgi:predicted nucleic acid-binding protein
MKSTTVRFVDTNVLLYSISREAGQALKREIANGILDNEDLALSAQVLQEFYVQATRSRRVDAITHEQAVDMVAAFSRFPIQPTTVGLITAAIDTCSRFGVSYWDAAIIEAARLMDCAELLSEDLQHGEDYDGVIVVNPFR